MRMPTASKVALAAACTYSWSPLAPRAPRERSSAAADKGNAVHEVCERLVRGEVVAWEKLPAEVAALARGAEAFLAAHPLNLPRAEVPLAYDVAAGVGREMPVKAGEVHRAYATAKSTEVVGTADVFAVGVILDWKTGRQVREEDAVDSAQLRTLALAAARAYGWREVKVGYVHLEPADYQADIETLGAWELDEHADLLMRIYTEIASGQQEPRPGPHCHDGWCPIRSVCPTTKAALEKIDAAAAKFVPTSFEIANDDDARKARVCLKLVKESVDALEANLKEYLRHSDPIDLGNGKVYGLKQCQRKGVDLNEGGAQIVVDAGAGMAINWTTSADAIEREFATRLTGKGEAKRATKALLEKLREAGCVRVSTYERFDESSKKTG